MDRTSFGSASQVVRRGSSLLAIAFVLSFFVNILRLSGPLFMMLVFDRVLPSRSEETLVALFAMLVIFLLAQGVIDYARKRLLARFGAQFQERLEDDLLTRTEPGELLEPGRSKPVAGLDEADGLRAFFHSTSLIAVYDFVWTPMFLVVIFVLDPLMGWVCLGGIGLILAFVLTRMAFVGSRESDAAVASRRISELKTMVAASRETIRSQQMVGRLKDRWLTARRLSRDRAIALKDWTVWFDNLCDTAVLLARYSVMAVGAWLTLEGTLTIGAMVAATFLVSRVLVPVEKFLTELPNMLDAWRNWGQLDRVLAMRKAEKGVWMGEQMGPMQARLALVNITVRSPLTAVPILKGLSLEVAPSQMVQVVGATGRGKTVLAETVLGLRKPSGGMILVNGLNIAQTRSAETERLFGYVAESPSFVAGTLAENIAHLDPELSLERVIAAARKACLHAVINALPDGYRTVIDSGASALSRGRRYQLALARAVYTGPKLLIIDEPDPLLFELLPETMDKTFDQLLKSGGSILILSRRRLRLRQISSSYQIEDGRLRLLTPDVAPAAKVMSLGEVKRKESGAPDRSLTPLIGR